MKFGPEFDKLRVKAQEQKSLKIVVCGPPHSGKSVFVLNLLQHLPREKGYCFRACPDGEGDWSGLSDQVLAKEIRIKGNFDEEFMSFAISSIRNTKKPVFLVDVGGRITDENRRVFSECDAFIIVSSDPEATREWREFGENLGLVCLAELESVLYGEDEIYDNSFVPIKARVSKLERGTFPESITIDCVAELLLAITEGVEEKSMATIVLDEVAERLGVEVTEAALPNGKVVRRFNWQGENLGPLSEAVADFAREQEVTIDGGGPIFLYAGLVHSVHPARVSTNDPKLGDFVEISELMAGDGGSDHLEWKVEDRGDYTFVEFAIPGGVFDVADLPKVVVPEVPRNKGIVISGRGPIWLSVAITMAYHNAAWVGNFYPPAGGAIVTVRHTPDAPALGEVVPDIY